MGTSRWLNRRGLKKSGYVYFIQSGGTDGPIKIGHSIDVANRLKELQTSSPYELVLLGSMKFDHPWQAAAFEYRLHHEVFWDLRLRGEWFRCDPRILRLVRTVTMVAADHEGTATNVDLHIRSIHESGEDLA
jgi:hypothetical protein